MITATSSVRAHCSKRDALHLRELSSTDGLREGEG